MYKAQNKLIIKEYMTNWLYNNVTYYNIEYNVITDAAISSVTTAVKKLLVFINK